MSRLILLVEEESMRVLLDGLLPRLFPSLSYLCVPHEGKHDLEHSIPRKLRAWREPGVRFAVLRDNDGGDCVALKSALSSMCRERQRDVLIRIVCQELEAWYLAEPEALADAFGRKALRYVGRKQRYRNPDAIRYPFRALKRLVPEFQKVSGARRMAPHLTRARNRSTSFQVFVSGVEAVAAELARGSGGGARANRDGSRAR